MYLTNLNSLIFFFGFSSLKIKKKIIALNMQVLANNAGALCTHSNNHMFWLSNGLVSAKVTL